MSVLLHSHASKDINTSTKLDLNDESIKHCEFAAISQCLNSTSRHGIITLLAVQIGETSICVCHYKYNMLITDSHFRHLKHKLLHFPYSPHNMSAVLEVCVSGLTYLRTLMGLNNTEPTVGNGPSRNQICPSE